MSPIQKLIHPRSVAVIGASADPRKTTGRPITYLLKHGFTGNVYPVNPKVERIGDLVCYPSIDALPEAPDVGIVLLGAGRAHEAVKALAQRGTSACIVLASGFGETGDQGMSRQAALTQAAGKMRILGPNTIGLVNLTDKIILSASAALEMDELSTGSIGLISQSGGILGSLLSRGASRGIGFSKLISTSNEVDLDLADFIEYLADDVHTRVIALYVETIRHPERFRQAVQKAQAAGKPVVAYKIGRSEAGARAAISHTGAMAGSDRMYDVFFEATGVIRANHFSDLLDICSCLTSGRSLHGKRVAVLTSTGGAGTLVADSLGVAGFEAPPPEPVLAQILRDLQQGDQAALDRNPIDVTLAGLDPVLLRQIMRAVIASDQYDALVVVVGSSSLAMPDLVADAVHDCLADTHKPILTYVSPHAPHVVKVLEARGVPALLQPESCAVALQAMYQSSHTEDPYAAINPVAVTHESARAGALNEFEAASLLAQFGIKSAPTHIVQNAEQAVAAAKLLGGNVVLKVLSEQILHKSDVGGVQLNLNEHTIAAALEKMSVAVQTNTGIIPSQFIVQSMLKSSLELIIGMKRDPLGAALMVGLGGVYAEIMHDSALRLLPAGHSLTATQARKMLESLKAWPLFNGYRGQEKLNVDAVIETICGFSNFIANMSDRLLEAEINPLMVMPAGQSVVAADAVIILAPINA